MRDADANGRKHVYIGRAAVRQRPSLGIYGDRRPFARQNVRTKRGKRLSTGLFKDLGSLEERRDAR